MADLFSDVLGFYALGESPWLLMKFKKVQHEDIDALPIHYKINVLLGLKVLYDRLAFCLETRSCDVDKVLRLVKEFFENLYRLRNEVTMVYYEAVGG